PTKDWECYCGKYKRVRYKGIICERCGVEVTRQKVRRERMGHIDLASPVSHIWFFKGVPSRIGYLLDIAPRELEKVLYFAASIVTQVDNEARAKDVNDLEDKVKGESERIYVDRDEQLADLEKRLARRRAFFSNGAEKGFDEDDDFWTRGLATWAEESALPPLEEARKLVSGLFLELVPQITTEDAKKIRELVRNAAIRDDRKLTTDLCLRTDGKIQKEDLDNLIQWALKVREMYLDIESRREDTREAAVDSVRRLEQTWQLFRDLEPKMVVNDEQLFRELKDRFGSPYGFGVYFRGGMGAESIRDLLRDLDLDQEAVDALFDNGRRGRAVTGPGNRPLKSLSDMLKGKQGRFRQNLLGKRVDYSGRSVIVAGPSLKLHQCGLPKLMALELFKPFIMSRLVERKSVQNIKAAKKHVESMVPEVWDVLEEVIAEHPVLLNRAPTLHRLGIQACEPVLVEGKAIQVHPLVCHAFNADFDGDQMAVHLPLSAEAQAECRTLMLSSNNILSPAHGRPLATPTQDMVLGSYYLTYCEHDLTAPPEEIAKSLGKKGLKRFQSEEEVEFHVESRAIGLQDPIQYRWNGELRSTTPGRVIFSREIERSLTEAILGA